MRRLDRVHRDVLLAIDSALEAANPANIVRRHLQLDHGTLHVDNLKYRLSRYNRIFVIGGGKASGYMGEEVERLLGARIAGGTIIVPAYLRPRPRGHRISYQYGTHPIPSEKNIQAVRQVLDLVETADSSDLVVFLLSGGASALLDNPVQRVSVRDEKMTTELLLRSGATIQEINTVRKHISRIKGGRLAELLKDTNLLTLIVSDVVGDPLDAIGSGPTVPDPTTYRDAKLILENYDVWSRIPVSVRRVITDGVNGKVPETPKDPQELGEVKNVLIGGNRESCLAGLSSMKNQGYDTRLLSTHIVGEAREVGGILGSIINDALDGDLVSKPGCFISGGETTVTVKGKGQGGRNQEFALAAAISIEGSKSTVVGSIGTDGVDGPTDAAGGLVDGTTVTRGRKLGMDPEVFLANNDSYHYLAKTGDLVKTGPTGTNVNDMMIMAIG